MRRAVIGGSAALLIVALMLAGCGGADTKQDTRTIHGYLSLVDSNGRAIMVQDGVCAGLDGYRDIGAGSPVTVRDDGGNVLATASLRSGLGNAYECNFKFAVDVPDAPLYEIGIGGRRGMMTYSRQEMDANGWSVRLTLGY